ncbi:hypothetical protein [Citrobacter portucalensis]|uniref:hypothetical protein n=1 Tax=Citrobacter portucalensis TaxID=1639133 RepID=UPI00226B173E|nr:hypothetical protein [Citrobacter portucalensis]MCX8985965.1 hypothetical protein [Citrobacter portucalensis]
MSEKDHADLESYIKESLSENTTADPVVPPQLKIKCPSKMEQSFATDSKRMPPPLVVPVKRTAKSTITETMLRTEGDQNIMMVASGPILTLPSGGEKIGELITTGSLSNLARGEERALAERQLELRTGQTVSPVSMSMSEWAKQMNIPITEILTKEVLAHLNEIPTDDRAQLYKELNAPGIRSIIRGSEAGRKLESALAASQTSIPSQTRDRAEVKSWFPKSTTSTKPDTIEDATRSIEERLRQLKSQERGNVMSAISVKNTDDEIATRLANLRSTAPESEGGKKEEKKVKEDKKEALVHG